MKKLFAVLCVILILSTLVITAMAYENNTASTDNPKIIGDLQNRSDKLAKRIEFLQFRQTILQKGETIRQNRETNLELATENTQLRKDIVDLLLAIKQDGGTVPQDVKDQLKAYNQQIKKIVAALKETRGEIKDIMAAYKQYIKDMNYEAVETAYNEIIAKQQYRAELLRQINSILIDMKALLSNIA